MNRKNCLKVIAACSLGAVLSFGALVAANASAVVKDFYIKPYNGVVTKAQVAIAVRRGYKGAKPKIKKVNSIGFPNAYAVRFMYKGKLKRVTFNQTVGRIKLTEETR